MSDRTRGVLIAVAFLASAVVFVPLAISWVFYFSLAEEMGFGVVKPTLLGGLVGLAAGFGPLVGALLTGGRKGIWIALGLVLTGMGITVWYLASTSAAP